MGIILMKNPPLSIIKFLKYISLKGVFEKNDNLIIF